MEETHKLVWNHIEITITYEPDDSEAHKEVYGIPLRHLEIESSVPLPITETGYRSHFIRDNSIQEWGGPVEYVKAWLDKEAQSPAWKEYHAQSQQLTLF